MQIEVNSNFNTAETDLLLQGGSVIMVTPPLDANYFIARVPLFADQAIVVFPKFSTIGCGFAQEQDWNTNLPISTDAREIYNHIAHNKKYPEITEQQCVEAIRMLQQWVEDQTRSTLSRLRQVDKEEINYLLLPEGLRAGLRRYIEHGVLPGDFLRSVIANDLGEAVVRADESNLAAILDIMRFMHNEAPSKCWGSREKMEAWHKSHPLTGEGEQPDAR